jgi:adenine-specific DNA-methyltransferase
MRNKVLQESKILEFIDFGDYNVFKQAGIQTMIFILKKEKSKNNNIEYLKLNRTEDIQNLLHNKKIINFQQNDFLNKPISFISKKEDSLLLDKIEGKENFQLSEKEVAQGIVGAPDECFILKDISQFSEKEKIFIKEFYTSSEKYGQPKSNGYIIYLSAKNFADKKIEDFPNLFKHFKSNELILTEAKIKYKTPNKPYYYLHREREEKFFKEGPKIISGSRVDGVQFLYTEKEFYGSRALNFIKTDRINLRYLVGILNSSLSFFWLKNKGKLLGKLLQIDKEPLLGIPICVADINYQNEISEKVTKIISKSLEMNNGLHKNYELICHEFRINKINKKLETFYLLSFDDFINESKVVFSIDKKSELLDYFNSQKETILKQKSEINDLSKEIDRLIYEIYDLTDNEINIIENNDL